MPYLVGPTPDHPNPALRRIDHLICEVPDIAAAFQHFTEGLGFPAAWPIGRFWPAALTADVGIGGINLEFIQPDEGVLETARITTIVFEPVSIEAALSALEREDLKGNSVEKLESDPGLLALRGFPPEMTGRTQLICRNVLVDGDVPIPFFLCAYSERLRERLDPENPRLASPHGRVRSISARMGDVRLFTRLGYQGEIEIRGEDQASAPPMVTEIRLETGPLDLQGFPAAFRFS